MNLNEYKKDPLISTVKAFCKKHDIEFSIDQNKGDYFDTRDKKLNLSPDKKHKLSYNLFVASHEYGHAFQYVHRINSKLDEDFTHFKLLLEGNKISNKIKARIVQTYLAQEHNATLVGLRLMKKLKCMPDNEVRRMINYQSNMQLIHYYMIFHNGIDMSDHNFKVPAHILMNPDSQTFKKFVKELTHLFKRYIVHIRLGNP